MKAHLTVFVAILALAGCDQAEIQQFVKTNEGIAKAWANKVEIKVDGLSCDASGECTLRGGHELLKIRCSSYDHSCEIREKITWTH